MLFSCGRKGLHTYYCCVSVNYVFMSIISLADGGQETKCVLSPQLLLTQSNRLVAKQAKSSQQCSNKRLTPHDNANLCASASGMHIRRCACRSIFVCSHVHTRARTQCNVCSMWGRNRRCQVHSDIQEKIVLFSEVCVGGLCGVGSCGTVDTHRELRNYVLSFSI